MAWVCRHLHTRAYIPSMDVPVFVPGMLELHAQHNFSEAVLMC